jgi:hypothetical protein
MPGQGFLLPYVKLSTLAILHTFLTLILASGYVCYRDTFGEPMCASSYESTSLIEPNTRDVRPTIPIYTTTSLPPATFVHTVTAQQSATGSSSWSSGSNSTPNTGAIAGGVIAGVIALVAIIAVVVLWRRKRPDGETQHPSAHHQPNSLAHNTSTVPPTPGTGDPFLTPMAQHQNSGASYFSGPGPASPGPSEYNGLPEPQQSHTVGGTMAMPIPRHDHHRSLSMSMDQVQRTEAARPQSGLGSGAPNSGLNEVPYAGHSGGDNLELYPKAWSNAVSNGTGANPNAAYTHDQSDGDC